MNYTIKESDYTDYIYKLVRRCNELLRENEDLKKENFTLIDEKIKLLNEYSILKTEKNK